MVGSLPWGGFAFFHEALVMAHLEKHALRQARAASLGAQENK